MKKYVVTLLLSILIILSCASTSSQIEEHKNYSINRTQQANVGSPMISNKVATLVKRKKWVGLLYSKDGWERTEEYTANSFQEELIYTGHSGTTIHISYREYKADFARPAFFQELRYDMKQSTIIVFKQYKIKILKATNEYIRFIVLND